MAPTARRFRVAALMIALLIATAAGFLIWQMQAGQAEERSFALQQTEDRARQLAHAVASRIEVLVRTADFVLLEARRAHGPDAARFEAIVGALAQSFPETSALQVTVANARGDVVYAYRPLSAPVNLSDRGYFRDLGDGRDRLVIAGPLVGRVGGVWTVLFVRPVIRQGTFAGVVTLSISPQYLSQVLAELELGPEHNVSLFATDGRYVARNRRLGDVLGRSVVAGRPFVGADAPRRGTFSAVATIGGEERIFAWERLPAAGLVAVVGLDKASLLAPLEHRFRNNWLAAIALATALLVFGAGILFLLSRIARQQRALASSEERYRALSGELEKRVAERTRDLEDALKELEAFSYSVSHDLRAPLRAIGAFAHMVREREGANLSVEGQRRLGVVEANAVKMGQLVDELLSFARLSRASLAKETVDMRALAGAVAAELLPAHPAARVSVGDLPAAQGDPTLLHQALVNLVGNALKYSARQEAPLVEVSWDAAARAYRVSDNGVGFDMQHAGKLFGTFERLHPESEFPGTGIGLAIVKRVVERHGGRVWAESAPGAGARFYFTLGEAQA